MSNPLESDAFKDAERRFNQNRTTAHKAVAAFSSFLATYIGVLIADLADAASWVNQVLVVAGGAVGTAWTYWAKNHPKR